MKTYSLRRIKNNSLAGYLQKDLIRKAQEDGWKKWSKTPDEPTKSYKVKKVDKNLLWWYNFSKNLVKQTLP